MAGAVRRGQRLRGQRVPGRQTVYGANGYADPPGLRPAGAATGSGQEQQQQYGAEGTDSTRASTVRRSTAGGRTTGRPAAVRGDQTRRTVGGSSTGRQAEYGASPVRCQTPTQRHSTRSSTAIRWPGTVRRLREYDRATNKATQTPPPPPPPPPMIRIAAAEQGVVFG